MPRVARVDEFVAERMASGSWTAEDRDRLYTLSENGASAMTLFNLLKRDGFEGGYNTVLNWKRSRDLGTVAQEMNARYRQARGLQPSDALNQLSAWMMDIIGRLYAELSKRDDLEKISTKDLLFLISTYGGKAQSAIAEADKIRTLHDNKDLILGTLEETRIAWRQSYEAENPEMLQLIDAVLDMVRVKLDL